jgi:hypothetical protein
MPDNLIDTVFPVRQGALAPNVTDPFSPGPGANNEHPAGVEAGATVPGFGTARPVPSILSTPASASAPNQTEAGAVAPGMGVADDSPEDDSNDNSGDGPVSVARTGTALGRVDGGLLMPGGTPVNVVDDRIATQAFAQGIVPTVNGGRT